MRAGLPARVWISLAALMVISAAAWYSIFFAENTTSAAELSNRCLSSAASAPAPTASGAAGGFGDVFLDHSLEIRGSRVSITQPCVVHLTGGVVLRISSGTQLEAGNLAIVDDGHDPSGARVLIEDSTISGRPGNGLAILMRHAKDTIVIHHATLDFPLSVWLSAAGEYQPPDQNGGMLEISDSHLRSVDPQSQGVRLIAGLHGGTGRFSNDRIDTSGPVLIAAGTCTAINLQGAPGACAIHA